MSLSWVSEDYARRLRERAESAERALARTRKILDVIRECAAGSMLLDEATRIADDDIRECAAGSILLGAATRIADDDIRECAAGSMLLDAATRIADKNDEV